MKLRGFGYSISGPCDSSGTCGPVTGIRMMKKRDNQDVIIARESELVSLLEEAFAPISVEKLLAISSGIEEVIRKYLVNNLSIHASNYFMNCRPSSKISRIQVDEMTYEIKASTDQDQRNLLNITISIESSLQYPRKPNVLTIDTHGIGRYKRVNIRHHPSVVLFEKPIADLVQTVINSGYAWLEESIRRAISNEATSFSKDVYSFIRSIIPNDSLWPKIWLWTIENDKAFYLPDVHVVDLSISSARKISIDSSYSLAEYYSEFITKVLPYNSTLTRKAFDTGECIDVDLRTASYKDDESYYHFSEKLLFGEDSLSILPIERLNSRNAMFAIGFPTAIKDCVLIVLERNKQQIISRLTKTTGKLSKLATLLEKSKPTKVEVFEMLVVAFKRFSQ
jgi:hypothetical protein